MSDTFSLMPPHYSNKFSHTTEDEYLLKRRQDDISLKRWVGSCLKGSKQRERRGEGNALLYCVYQPPPTGNIKRLLYVCEG